jgi:hypothetical protein
MLNPDPDSQTQLNLDPSWIRIRNTIVKKSALLKELEGKIL